MNNIPKILIKDGYTADQSGNLTSITIPATVDTLQVPTEVTTYSTSINWLPSNSTTLQVINAPNLATVSENQFQGWTALRHINLGCLGIVNNKISNFKGDNKGNFQGCTNLISATFPNLTGITCSGNYGTYNGLFASCTSLTSIDMPNLTSIYEHLVDTCSAGLSNSGMFSNCTSLTTVNMPKLSTIRSRYLPTNWGQPNLNGLFYKCTSIKELNLPLLTSISVAENGGNNSGVFQYCTGLEKVILGSKGHPVTSISNALTFAGCTQSNLTITIRVTDPDTPLANQPWGATNATIYYIGIDEDEDAEDRIFNPQNYT